MAVVGYIRIEGRDLTAGPTYSPTYCTVVAGRWTGLPLFSRRVQVGSLYQLFGLAGSGNLQHVFNYRNYCTVVYLLGSMVSLDRSRWVHYP